MRLQKKNRQGQNPDWLQIPDHLYKILIVGGGSGSRKKNSLLNLIHHRENDDFIVKIFLHVKDPYKPSMSIS